MNKNILLFGIFFLLHSSSFAFRPVAHIILKDRIVRSLRAENPFRIAMEKYPAVASWGAIGPDLGYNVDFSRTFKTKWKRQIKNSWQIADLAHYHKAGTFISNLVNEAIQNKDEKLMAFAGGWLTHVAGDFASHGIYVKPEAGYYIADETGRDLHGELEKMSDAYLFSLYANDYSLSDKDFISAGYWEKFFGIKLSPSGEKEKEQNLQLLNELIGGSVEGSFIKVYKETFGVDKVNFDLIKLASTYSRSVGVGLGAVAGFKQYPVNVALDSISLHCRKQRIDSAFEKGIFLGNDFLSNPLGTHTRYSDTWNLDIGENGEPTYIIRIDAEKKLNSRTKSNILVTFKSKKGERSSPVNLKTKIGPLKFAFYQEDTYYYALNLGGRMGENNNWKLELIDSAEIRMKPRKFQLFGNAFKLKQLVIYYNGKTIAMLDNLNNKKSIRLTKNKPLLFSINQY